MQGHQVRSRVQWLKEGEKPSKYFCSLEHQNYIEKTIKQLILKDGSICVDQQRILQEIANYYSHLFKSFDNQLTDINLENLTGGIPIRKLTKI